MPRVTAAVLNFNGRALLDVVLPSILHQSYRDFDLIVVDDCSTDGSVDYISQRWPMVRVVPTGPVNVGISAALNVAVRSSGSEFVALINNDIELEPAWLGELVAALDSHPEAATAAGKLLQYHRRELIDSAGDIFTRSATAWGRGAGEVDRGQFDAPQEIFAPTAGAALYRASALADVGQFDESFHAYYEDVDWGLRAQLAGFRSRYVPTAVGFHMGSTTTGGDKNRRYYALQRRNAIAVLAKDVPWAFAVRYLPYIVIGQLLSLTYSIRARMLRPHLRGWASAGRELPGWLRARRQIMSGRRISARDFDRFVSPRRQ
jgi:GT2 family glycosyltransferase